MRMISNSLTESIYSSLNKKSVNKVDFRKLNESKKIWSSDQEEEYYNNLTREEMLQICDYNGWDTIDNGTPVEDASDEELRAYVTPDFEDYNGGAYEDFVEAILPEIEKQCVGDFLVFYGEAANWHSRGEAAKVINIDELESIVFPNYDATTSINVDNGNLTFSESSHDVPTGFSMGLYSFKSDNDFMNAEKELKKIFDDEDFDMYYFKDYVGFNEVKTLIESNLLTPVKNTINDYTGNENMNESVTVTAGSTTVISDESGVTVEDNGNTITAGNGATVDVDNEADILPAEMDLSASETDLAPTEELVDDEEELTEAIDKDGGPFPYLMKHGQGPGTLPKDVKVVKYGESSNGKDIVYLDKVLTAEEEAKFEMTPMANLQDDNLNEATQNVDVFANPEFDYKITDITTLQPTDSGDVRAIDMNDILVGLDEALTERYQDENFVKLNSILTKCGKDYDSAILEVSFPGCKGYLLSFESAFNPENKIYECNVREATTSKKIEHLCVKSRNPIRAFENAIVDLVNMKTIINSHENLSEDIDLLTHSSNVEDNNGVIYTNDKRVEDNIEKNKKRFKKIADRYKKSDKYEVKEEPDQDNTQGKEVDTISDLDESANLNEAEWRHELSSGTELRKALEDFDDYDIKTAIPALDALIKACDEAKQYVDEYDAKQLEGIKDEVMSHRDTISDSNFDEDEYENYEPQEEIDYLLDKFYDICDANKIWVKLTESDGGFNANEDLEETEYNSDEAMTEDILPKAIFHRKPKDVDTMIAEEKNNITVNQSSYKIINTKELESSEFEEFANNLLKSREWLKELYVNDDNDSGVFNCIEVTGGDYSILVDPSGYDYVRYAAILNNIEESDETEETEEKTESEIA